MAFIDYIQQGDVSRVDSQWWVFYQYLSPGVNLARGQRSEDFLFTHWVSILDLFISAIMVSEYCMGYVWQIFNMQQMRNSKQTRGYRMWEFCQVSLPDWVAKAVDEFLAKQVDRRLGINDWFKHEQKVDDD